jgi:hypothetical protein
MLVGSHLQSFPQILLAMSTIALPFLESFLHADTFVRLVSLGKKTI